MKYVYKLGNSTLESTTVIRDLVVLISPDLKFKEHVREITSRASMKANWLFRSFILKEPRIYVKLFEIYVLPILTFASPVWYPVNLSESKLVTSVQKSFMR